MELKVKFDKIYDTTVWLSKVDKLSFDIWHQIVTFIAEKPKLKNYIIINKHVIDITPGSTKMTPIHLFKDKKMLKQMHRKTFGSTLRDTFIAFDIFNRRKTIEEVLALETFTPPT
jgi:hypothetical protein